MRKPKLRFYYEVVFLDGSKLYRDSVTKTFALSVYNQYIKSMILENVKRATWGKM